MARFMAVFTGTPGARGGPMDEAEMRKGMQAWSDWMERYADRIVESGGPLGRTKRVSRGGIAEASNNMAAFVVIEADDHEAAARMFEGHPHFTIFPGDGVDVMPVLPVPTM